MLTDFIGISSSPLLNQNSRCPLKLYPEKSKPGTLGETTRYARENFLEQQSRLVTCKFNC